MSAGGFQTPTCPGFGSLCHLREPRCTCATLCALCMVTFTAWTACRPLPPLQELSTRWPASAPLPSSSAPPLSGAWATGSGEAALCASAAAVGSVHPAPLPRRGRHHRVCILKLAPHRYRKVYGWTHTCSEVSLPTLSDSACVPPPHLNHLNQLTHPGCPPFPCRSGTLRRRGT